MRTRSGYRASAAIISTGLLAGLAACTGGSAGFPTRYGQQAVELARHVPGCSKVRREAAEAGLPATRATCVISSYNVHFYAWTSPEAAHTMYTTYSSTVEASGPTWRAMISANGFDTTPSREQRQIAARIAKALGGKAG